MAAQPYSRSALVKLLEIHIKGRNFKEAIEILEHLISIEDNDAKKSSYNFTIATIYRSELNQPTDSLPYYEATLDLNPDKLDAFQAIDEILTQEKDWDNLETAYRKMIARIRNRGQGKIEFTLYKNLGEIYRSRLKKLDMAIWSFELAAKVDPEAISVHQILAQLYEMDGQEEKAVGEHRKMVYLEPDRVESYRRMAHIHRQMGQVDDAWFALAVLAMAGKCDPDEKAFYDELKPAGLVSPVRTLDPSLWAKTVFSKIEETPVGEVFQIFYQVMGSFLEGKDLKDPGLKKKDEVDLTQKTVFTAVYNKVAQTLGIAPPHVFLQEQSFGLRIENTVPPILIAGRDMMHGKSEKELAFMLGKQLAYFHPMHILAQCYQLQALKLFYQVCLKAVHPEAKVAAAHPGAFQAV